MSNLRSTDAELFNVVLSVIERVRQVSTGEVFTAQDAMISLRVDWEDLQAKLRSRTFDGFEPVVDMMMQLSATSIAVAAALQAKIINQRIKQMETDKTDELDLKPLAPVKAKRGRKPKVMKMKERKAPRKLCL